MASYVGNGFHEGEVIVVHRDRDYEIAEVAIATRDVSAYEVGEAHIAACENDDYKVTALTILAEQGAVTFPRARHLVDQYYNDDTLDDQGEINTAHYEEPTDPAEPA